VNEGQSIPAIEVNTNLVRWDVPFAEGRDPSVSLITEQGGDVATLVVAPMGTDQYPKFLVRIESVIAVLSYEEAFTFDRGYRELSGIDARICAYRWMDSPWLQSYREGAGIFGWASLQHYLVFGGDSIVEIIAAGEPTIQRIEFKQLLSIQHEL